MMCEIVDIPIEVIKEVQAIHPCHYNDSDRMMQLLEWIMDRHHLDMGDPLDLWETYVDWCKLENYTKH